MSPPPGTASADGLPVLGSAEVSVMTAVDTLVSRRARHMGAEEIGLPAMLAARDLARIDYFANFPQLVNVVTTLTPEAHSAVTGDVIPSAHLAPADLVLPSAACYGAYFAHSGRTLDAPVLLTTRALCARAESHYSGLRRLRTFHMREIVHLGTRESAERFAGESREWVARVAGRLGTEARLLPASDPFFEAEGSRAVMQRMSRLKEELVYDGDLAVASVNQHRNFFGERCGIRLPDGEFAYSACFGAGLERWTHMLLDSFGGDAERAVRELGRIDRIDRTDGIDGEEH
ncbi:hypothetical protein [Streptomyces sp. NPDC048172]|uniref:hypothetical protein n=1 Tax=Streptomyces sp. NPDC048172 TaxID=3365505 RepID=UPI003720F5F7